MEQGHDQFVHLRMTIDLNNNYAKHFITVDQSNQPQQKIPNRSSSSRKHEIPRPFPPPCFVFISRTINDGTFLHRKSNSFPVSLNSTEPGNWGYAQFNVINIQVDVILQNPVRAVSRK